MSNAPVRYSPSIEKVEPDEQQVINDLNEQFKTIQDTTSKDYDHAVRAVHSKAHGIAAGTFTVLDGLPAELAQGLFATPGEHEAVLRISTNAGDLLDDAVSLPRGLALKVLGVEGERLPFSQGDTTQDFILVNGPVFSAKTGAQFLSNLKMLAKTTDTAEGGKKALSGVLQTVDAVLETVGIKSPTIQQLGGAPQVHPLGQPYYSQTPFRYGDYVAKFGLFPVSKNLTGLGSETVNASGRPDALREAVNEELIEQGGTWEFRVQLCTDLEKMPVEDPTQPWDENESPFRAVATLKVEPQLGWENGVTNRADDALGYNIWHALAAHQPLGNINRARRETYQKAQDFRGSFNGCPIHEPKTLAEVG